MEHAYIKFNAYSGRRGFIGVAETLEPKLDISERHALGMWRINRAPPHYSHSKLQESYTAKKVVVEAIRRAALEMGNWEFRWGDIPRCVPDITVLKSEAQMLSADITVRASPELVDLWACQPSHHPNVRRTDHGFLGRGVLVPGHKVEVAAFGSWVAAAVSRAPLTVPVPVPVPVAVAVAVAVLVALVAVPVPVAVLVLCLPGMFTLLLVAGLLLLARWPSPGLFGKSVSH